MTSPFAAAARSPFARPQGPEADAVPPAKLTRAQRRRTAALAEAADVLPHLPGPGEALHALMTGRFDLCHLLLCVLDKLPGPVLEMRVATLSYNAANLAELLRLLDGGKVRRLGFLVSAFFRDHTPEVFTPTVAAFHDRGQRFAAARNHAKVITIDAGAAGKLVIEGSANLRSNSNQEQLALIHDAGLHDWHSAWIDALIDRHQTNGPAIDKS